MSDLEHLDVLVVGAGLSGVGAAYRLSTMSPSRSWAILEARDSIGGTWDLFRYPGVRSDSDMMTLGFPFEPWTDPDAIADGPKILDYLRTTADKYGITERIRFGHRVVAADWSSEDARWTVTVERGEAGEGGPEQLTCSFLYLCSGYYDYERPHDPQLPGIGEFEGQVVHPQFWPEDLDVSDRKVVVIGSGATAVTLVPALADRGADVTMLQRTPTWIASLPRQDRARDVL
ncbi:NAD(P)/FAD-dependent oxidoreductase, partial [Terrabacter terrae]